MFKTLLFWRVDFCIFTSNAPTLKSVQFPTRLILSVFNFWKFEISSAPKSEIFQFSNASNFECLLILALFISRAPKFKRFQLRTTLNLGAFNFEHLEFSASLKGAFDSKAAKIKRLSSLERYKCIQFQTPLN